MGDTGDAFKAYNEFKKEEISKKHPKRVAYAKNRLDELGINYKTDGCSFLINLPKGTITFWAYTGWFCGQKPYGKIKGRGIDNLCKSILTVGE